MASRQAWGFRAVRWAGVGCVGLALQACGGGGDGGPVGPQTKPVATVSVTLAESEVFVGDNTQATVTLRDSGGATLTGRTVSWSSSATGVATVSQTGLVTGVAPGSAQITATSEGKSGSATVTVEVDPATTANVEITGLTQNGVNVDLTQVAGTITINLDETVPTGFTGTVTVMVDTVLVSQTTYPAASVTEQRGQSAGPAAMDASGAYRGTRAGPRSIEFNTATPIVTISADQLEARGKLANGVHELLVTLAGTVNGTPVNEQASLAFSTANPENSLIGIGRWNSVRGLTLTDGRRFETGDGIEFKVAELNYGTLMPAQIDQVEIIHGDAASAAYGADAIAGVVNLITRNHDFSNAQFACESGMFGTVLDASEIRRGSFVRDPQTQPFVNPAGRSIDVNLNGFADIFAAPSSFTLPAGVTGQIVVGDYTAQLPDGWFPLDDRFFCDNRGPTIDLGAFQALGRNPLAWQPLPLLDGNALPLDNILPAQFDLEHWIDESKIGDGGVGLRASTPYEIFSSTGTTIGDVFANGTKWTGTLSATTGYDVRLGLRAYDLFDNPAEILLTTTDANPIGINGTPTSAGQTASIRVIDDAAGAFSSFGVRDRFWSRSSSFNPFYRFQGDLVGTTENFLTGSFTRNGSCVIGVAPDCLPVVIPTTRNFNQAFISFSNVLAQAGGTREGFWEGNFSGYNLGGLQLEPQNIRIRGLYDFTPPAQPVASGNAITESFDAGELIPFSFSVTDNMHISQVGVSLRFEGYLHTGFERGYVEVPFVLSEYYSPWSERNATWNDTYSAALPSRFVLAQPGTGLLSSAPVDYTPLTGYSLFGYDAVEQRSPFLDFPIPLNFLPSLQTFNNTRVTISSDGNTGCLGRDDSSTPCPVGALKKLTVTGVALSPQNDNQGITGMHVFGINSMKQVFRLCQGLTATETTVGADLRQEFACEVDFSDYKGAAGAMDVFAWFVSPPRGAGKTQFLPWTLVLGSRGSGM